MEKKTARILTLIGIILIIFFLIPLIYLFMTDPMQLYILTEGAIEFSVIFIVILTIIILIAIMIILVNVFSD